MNTAFRDHVTSTSFHMTLSKQMILHLVMIANDNYYAKRRFFTNLGMNDTVVPTRGRLKERGLIEPISLESPGIYKLTRAGELMIELLREAGLVKQYEELMAET